MVMLGVGAGVHGAIAGAGSDVSAGRAISIRIRDAVVVGGAGCCLMKCAGMKTGRGPGEGAAGLAGRTQWIVMHLARHPIIVMVVVGVGIAKGTVTVAFGELMAGERRHERVELGGGRCCHLSCCTGRVRRGGFVGRSDLAQVAFAFAPFGSPIFKPYLSKINHEYRFIRFIHKNQNNSSEKNKKG